MRNLMTRLRIRDFHFVVVPSLNPSTKSIETSICGGHMRKMVNYWSSIPDDLCF